MLIYHYLHSVILHHATRILNDALGIPNYPSRIPSMHLGAQNMHLQHAHGIPHFALEIPHYALGIPQYASEILNHIPPSLHKIMIYFNLQMFFDAHLACKSCDFPTIYLQIFPTLHVTHMTFPWVLTSNLAIACLLLSWGSWLCQKHLVHVIHQVQLTHFVTYASAGTTATPGPMGKQEQHEISEDLASYKLDELTS